MKILIKKQLSECQMHGLSNLYRSEKKIYKFMWLILLLAGSAGTAYFMYKSIADYLEFDNITNIDVFHEQPTAFPAVSICSRQQYNFSNFKEITYCSFNYEDDCFNHPEQYFHLFDDPHYGVCYRFNSGPSAYNKSIKVKNSIFAGKDNGFELDLRLDPMDDFNTVILHIHNQSDLPFGLLNKGYNF